MPPELATEALTTEPPLWRRVRFPLTYAFYALAVLGASLGVFGAWGLVAAALVLAVWTFIFACPARSIALNIVLFLLAYLGFCVFVATSEGPREIPRRLQCQNNLRQIALAIHNYEATYGSLPPAYVADAAGKPMHSWRVLLLPFLEENALYKKYNFQEPWNGPNNSRLVASTPPVFRCPSREPVTSKSGPTSYFAVVGPHTVWPGATAIKLSEITDGSSSTLLLLEDDSSSVNWLEPRDVSEAEAIALLSERGPNQHAPHHGENFLFADTDQGRVIAYADASVHYQHNGLPQEIASALIERNDGRTLTLADFDVPDRDTRSRPLYANWLRLGGFVFLILFPFPWVWIHPHGAAAPMGERGTSP